MSISKRYRHFLFNQRSNKSGLVEEKMHEKPFGNLATRTMGVSIKIWKGGASGLELKYDSLLRGVPGVKIVRKYRENGWTL